MKTIRFLLWFGWIFIGFFSNSHGETFNDPNSIALARYAQFANSCIISGRLTGKESMPKIEEEIYLHFKSDYLGVCGPILDGIGELQEISEVTKDSDQRILAFSRLTEAPQSSRWAKIAKPLEGRYVIYFDKRKQSFAGLFFPTSQFITLMLQQGSNVDTAELFRFPILRKQRSAVRPSDHSNGTTGLPSSGNAHEKNISRTEMEDKSQGVHKEIKSLNVNVWSNKWILGLLSLGFIIIIIFLMMRRTPS